MATSFGDRLGHAFRDPALLRQALTHRSYGTPHNERLEFVGDAVLNCVVARALYDRFPDIPEGDLSRARASLVNQETLAKVARRLGLGGGHTARGRGAAQRRRQSCVHPRRCARGRVGAVFLDAGFDAARAGHRRG
jgi:ribonuclease-3